MSRNKTLQELTIKDDFMFGAVMSDAENCRRLLEQIIRSFQTIFQICCRGILKNGQEMVVGILILATFYTFTLLNVMRKMG